LLAGTSAAQDSLPAKATAVSEKDYFPLSDMTDRVLLYFEIQSDTKAALLYQWEGQLYYALIREDDRIEFHFPQIETLNTKRSLKEKAFKYSPGNNWVDFNYAGAKYQIYETDQSLGIKVTTRDCTYELKGIKATAIGSLKQLKRKLTNVVSETI